MNRKQSHTPRPERLLTVAKVELLFLLGTGLLLWFLHSREQAAKSWALRNRILFVAIRLHLGGKEKTTWDLMAMDPDGRHKVNLTRDEALEIDPVGSPDGRQIAFA